MNPIEALRKARATMDCGGVSLLDGCEFGSVAPYSHETYVEAAGIGPVHDVHRTAASALLDGFSVDEVTAAEEALK